MKRIVEVKTQEVITSSFFVEVPIDASDSDIEQLIWQAADDGVISFGDGRIEQTIDVNATDVSFADYAINNGEMVRLQF
ncbi:hypothetical protein ACFBZI_11640 [Moraxella sp. ZJ142]|uniref:hypothetical protein n=1 Tax=Moraxella marmotae TaxID=3344520 RepID=UPI0035D50BA7